MYGFNLGQIEGLDSSVQTVTLTIANATESNTYTLPYVSFLGGWADSTTPQTATIALSSTYPGVDGFALIMFAYDASKVGQTYNIQIKSETVEASFKSATEQVINQTVKTKFLYVNQSDVSNSSLGTTDLPLYNDKDLTERARTSNSFGYDVYIIHGVSRGSIVAAYSPYYTFDRGCNFIYGWGAESPYRARVIFGQFEADT